MRPQNSEAMLEAETEAEDIECRHKWPKLSKKLHIIGTTRLPMVKYDLLRNCCNFYYKYVVTCLALPLLNWGQLMIGATFFIFS